jgi:hypothetical protein
MYNISKKYNLQLTVVVCEVADCGKIIYQATRVLMRVMNQQIALHSAVFYTTCWA